MVGPSARSETPDSVTGTRPKRGAALPDAATAALLAGAAFAWFCATLPRTLDLRDEGYLYDTIARVAQGEVPHRDFASLYGPAVFALNALLFRLFGPEILPVRFSLAALRAAQVALAFLVARRLAPRPVALLAAGLAIAFWGRVTWNLNSPYAASYTIPLGLLALALLLRGLATDSRAAFLAAGLAAGASILFKQSLGCMLTWALGLAILAAGLLREAPPEERRGRGKAALLALWGALGASGVLPFLRQLGPLDYALHLLPLHALMALVGLRFARRGSARTALAFSLPRALRFGLGCAVLPGALAGLYAYWGALGALVYQMFAFPGHLQNYYLPVNLPPPRSLALLAGTAAAIHGGLLLLRGARVTGAALAVAGAALLAWPLATVPDWIELRVLVHLLDNSLPAAVAYAALAVLAAGLARPDPALGPPPALLVAALFLQLAMAFQIFPRASFNGTLMLGTLTPLLGFLCWRWSRLAGAGDALPPRRRRAALALVALLPLGLGAPVLLDGWDKAAGAWTAPWALRVAGARGVAPWQSFYEKQGIASVEWLLDHLERATPPAAPLVLLTNEYLIHFLSPRQDLFADAVYSLHLFGWGMLPESYREQACVRCLVERLAQSRDAIVVDKDDFASSNLRSALPELFRYVDANFEEEYRVGLYRVLRRRAS